MEGLFTVEPLPKPLLDKLKALEKTRTAYSASDTILLSMGYTSNKWYP